MLDFTVTVRLVGAKGEEKPTLPGGLLPGFRVDLSDGLVDPYTLGTILFDRCKYLH